MFKALCDLIFHKIMGWRIVGADQIKSKKFIIAVAPHTSYWDFPIGILIRPLINMNAKFIIKSELFKNPLVARILTNMGGIPVDRKKKKNNLIKQVIAAYDATDDMCIAIAPEGTRSAVKEWKKGFYYIATGANISIVLCAFDFGKKEVNFFEEIIPTGNAEEEIEAIRKKFIGIKGKRPELGVM